MGGVPPFAVILFPITFWPAACRDGGGGVPPFAVIFFLLIFWPAACRDGGGGGVLPSRTFSVTGVF